VLLTPSRLFFRMQRVVKLFTLWNLLLAAVNKHVAWTPLDSQNLASQK